MLSYSGGLSSQQQKQERKRKSADVQRLYERDYQQTMVKLQKAIKTAQGRVKEELEHVRSKCLEEREALSAEAGAEFEEAIALLRQGKKDVDRLRRAEHKDALAKIRDKIAKLREELRAEQRGWPDIWKAYAIDSREKFEAFVKQARFARDEKVRRARAECIQRGTSALREAQELLAKLTAEKDERDNDRKFKKGYEASKRREPKAVSSKQRAKERKAESDDEVRSNLEAVDPRLVSMFELYKKKVEGNERLSRTEAFLQMYEEDKGNMDAALWAKEEEETNRYLEKQYKERMAQEKEREKRERQAKAKRSQASFGMPSGADLTGDPRQLTMDVPRKQKRQKVESEWDTSGEYIPF